MNRLARWIFGLRGLFSGMDRMRRCVDVECVLFDVANGKRALLTRDECRELALKLGTAMQWRMPKQPVGAVEPSQPRVRAGTNPPPTYARPPAPPGPPPVSRRGRP